jgi:hypothetical protein
VSDPDKALATQLANISARTGKSFEELRALLDRTGFEKHGELRDHLKRELGLGHGDANTVVTLHLGAKSAPVAVGAPGEGGVEAALATIYAGGKAPLRPLHDAAMAAIAELGPFEIAPKKAYLSLRRKKQFATVGPGSKGRLEIGLNMKGVAGAGRLEALAPGGMCQYRVYVADAGELDAELHGWLGRAYESAG